MADSDYGTRTFPTGLSRDGIVADIANKLAMNLKEGVFYPS